MSYKIRPIAIHLPQFHPIPENDAWWGKGFTEWTNVAKAKPLFKGHYQPHLPADLGFYDLRLEEARLAQEALAKQYGIYGFCYYHYWFNGKRMLHEPIERKLKNPKEDLPFMFCWANENWTKVWDGNESEVLLKQEYSLEDDCEHIRYLIPFFKDSRYIKIDGKPVFAIYRSTLLPDVYNTIEVWREEARRHGIELYICRFESKMSVGKQYMDGFDAAIEFPPHISIPPVATLKDRISLDILSRSLRYRFNKYISKIYPDKSKMSAGVIREYADILNASLEKQKNKIDYKLYHTVTPGWDNSARRSTEFLILNNSTPELFELWTLHSLQNFRPYSEEENLFFINAWNEWAEGNHLEPDQKWGLAYLEALKNGIEKFVRTIG